MRIFFEPFSYSSTIAGWMWDLRAVIFLSYGANLKLKQSPYIDEKYISKGTWI